MNASLLIPLVVAGLSGGGFVVNEWSHGEMAEAMGLGHHHMLDYDGVHCAAHNNATQGQMHAAHMHGNSSVPHDGCAGGAAMHGGAGDGGMMR